MNLFGVGPTELFLVLIVVLVLFGPDKLPEIAKRIAGASREIRENLNTLNDQMNSALETSMDLDKARMTPPAEPVSPENPPAIPATGEVPPVEAALVQSIPPDDNRILPDTSDVAPPPPSPNEPD